MAVLQALRRNDYRDNRPDQDSAGPEKNREPFPPYSEGLQQEHL